MKTVAMLCVLGLGMTAYSGAVPGQEATYPAVDTGQTSCYDAKKQIPCPAPGDLWFGQDAQYQGNEPRYVDNGDGTVSDLVTGLMWTKRSVRKMSWAEAVAEAAKCRVGGYEDWRLPTIKELYSLIKFNGVDPDPRATDTRGVRPFIDDAVFEFQYGDRAQGERIIDAQYVTSTLYSARTMWGNKTVFGVNFADGRIKGYPAERIGPRVKTFHVLYVRGNLHYGKNDFIDNGDGTITDRSTGLMWTKSDSGRAMDWPSALRYAEELDFAGYDDWRLPNAKELQSIVDYTRCPDTTGSAAIAPIFECTPIRNEGGQADFGFYWTSTTHVGAHGGSAAVYVAFGRAGGFMSRRGGGPRQFLDVHGAGAQRSDPKTGDPSRFPYGRGPQGDVVRILNFVRCVRGGNVRLVTTGAAKSETTRRYDRCGCSPQLLGREKSVGAGPLSPADARNSGGSGGLGAAARKRCATADPSRFDGIPAGGGPRVAGRCLTWFLECCGFEGGVLEFSGRFKGAGSAAKAPSRPGIESVAEVVIVVERGGMNPEQSLGWFDNQERVWEDGVSS